MTFTEALCNKTTRSLIDCIEYLWGSLDHGEREDLILEETLDYVVSELRKHGVDFDPRTV